MPSTPACPQCTLQDSYIDGANHVCPHCGFEWSAQAQAGDAPTLQVRDANGNPLSDGDTVTLIKDLKLKGSSGTLKMGTRFKNIRLVEGDHDVDVGSYMLKSCFLKKG
jgi:protein PhnA